MESKRKRQLICVGIITLPHGVKGNCKIKSFTERPENLKKYSPFTDVTGAKTYKITSATIRKDHLIVQFLGVDNRDDAERLKGSRLYVDEDILPPTAEDEFYYSQLIGLQVKSIEGIIYGEVVTVQNFGAGDLLEISITEQEQVLIPFTKEVVPIVDIGAGFIKILPPEGLLDQTETNSL